MAACLGLLVLVVQAAPLPSVDGMTDLAADGYLELKRRFQFDRTVGVIGSSGNLLYRSHGSEIDRLGVVMRFNGAVTAGYTNDVGVGGDSGDLSGERLIRCAWKHGWEDAKHSQQLGGTSVLAPHEFAIRTCPIAGCTDSYPVQTILPSRLRPIGWVPSIATSWAERACILPRVSLASPWRLQSRER